MVFNWVNTPSFISLIINYFKPVYVKKRVIAQSGFLAFESSGDQIDLSHLKAIFEFYPSYHLGQVVGICAIVFIFSVNCPSSNIMCNISSQSFYRQIAAFGYFGSYILINSSKAFSASAFVSACPMLCNEPLAFAWADLGKQLSTFIVLCIQHRAGVSRDRLLLGLLRKPWYYH